jgi:hypothetical protein
MEIQGVVNARNYVFRVGLPEHIHEFLRGDADADMEAGFDDVFDSLGGEGGIEVDSSTDEELAATFGIIQLVNRIITESERLGASDIHIEPGKDDAPGGVRIRVDGICRELLKVPKEHCAAITCRAISWAEAPRRLVRNIAMQIQQLPLTIRGKPKPRFYSNFFNITVRVNSNN